MNRTAKLFFLAGAIFALTGMAWGIQMSASHDHSLAPAHGHLNLLGFVAMSVFGTYYALAPSAAVGKLAKLHFGLALLTVLILVPGIVLAITEQGETLAQIGSLIALLSMAVFVAVILRNPAPVAARS